MNHPTVGPYTYGHESIQIFDWGEGSKLSIGNYCSIASGLRVFLGGNHNILRVTTYPFGHIFEDIFGSKKTAGHPLSNGDVRIGNDVWIGASSTIMSGVNVGDGAVIAANSHVVRDVRPYEIVGGNPIQHIRFRFSQEIIERLLELKWWDQPTNKIKKIVPLLTSEISLEIIKKLELELRESN